MIAKLSTGNGFGGATRYLLRDGMSDEEKAKVKVLAAVGVDYTIADDGSITLDAKQVGRDFRFQAMMHPSVRKPVYDIALSWKVGEHIPSDEKLARTEELLKLVGLVNTQYVIIEHEKENEHSHAIVNIVDNDGNRISTHNLIERMLEAARMITENYGYAWGDTQKKETTNKIHKPQERARYIVKPIVEAAVAKAEKISDLPELLKPSGVECHIKRSAAGDVEGISFAYKMDGQLRRFRGSDLHRSLSAKQIERRLAAEKLAGEPEIFIIHNDNDATLYTNRPDPWPKNLEKLHETARTILKYYVQMAKIEKIEEETPSNIVEKAVKGKQFGTVTFDVEKARFVCEESYERVLENPEEVIKFTDHKGQALDLFTSDFWEYWKEHLEQTKIFVQMMAKYSQESQAVEKAQTPAPTAKPVPEATPVAKQQTSVVKKPKKARKNKGPRW